jgi:hypothetical protein
MQLIDRITPVENNSGSGGLHNEEDYVRDPPLTIVERGKSSPS